MKVNAAPLLYGRTYKVDFSSNFLAQPADYSEEQAEKAFSIVQGSMDHIDFLHKNGRIVIYSDGEFITYGRTVVFSELFAECNREPLCGHLDHKVGRNAYGFIGIVFKVTKEEKQTFILPSGMLSNLYQELIVPRWEESVRAQPTATQMRTFEVSELTSQLVDSNSIISKINDMQSVYLCNTEGSLNVIIDSVLKLAFSGIPVSFCSDADDMRVEYRNLYNIIAFRHRNSLNSLTTSGAIHRSIPSTSNDIVKRKSNNNQFVNSSSNQDGKKEPLENDSRNTGKFSHDTSPKGIEGEIARALRVEGIKTSKIDKTDAVMGTAIVAGVTYCVIGVIMHANPIALVTVGAVTIVLTGIEAKRIIDKLKS